MTIPNNCLAALDQAIKAVCPIYGIDSNSNIRFLSSATTAQIDAANNVVATFNCNHPPLVAAAQEGLIYCYDVANRCTMAGIAFPAAWQTYSQALKAIYAGTDTTSTTLPSSPAEPAQIVLYQV